MSKIKFGNFITYKGKNLATPKAKAIKGNLVFAEITEGADKGYYIFGGVAEGHLVTFDVFNALKAEVAALNTKVGDLTIDGKPYADVPAYVDAKLAKIGGAAALGVTTDVRDADTAKDDVLPTEKAVRTAIDDKVADYKVKDIYWNGKSIVGETGIAYVGSAITHDVADGISASSDDLVTASQVYDAINAIPEVVVAQGTGIVVGSTTADGETTYTVSVDDTIATKAYVGEEIGKLGDVMTFIGVASEKPVNEAVALVGGTTVEATKGDVVTVQASGEEYVWTGDVWIEIGKVSADEAVTTLGGANGDITLGTGLSMVGKQLTVTFPEIDVQGEQKTVTIKGKDVIGVTGVVTGNNTEYEVSLKIGPSGNVNLTQTANGLSAYVKTEDLAYTNDKSENDINNVVAALDELYDDEEVVAQSLVDLNGRVDGIEGTVEDIRLNYTRNVYAASEEDETGKELPKYITITPKESDQEGVKDYEVKLEIASGSTGSAGLVTMDTLEVWSNADHVKYNSTKEEIVTVKVALDDLYSKVADAALSGNAENITYGGTTGSTATNVEAALDELYSQIAALDGAVVKSVTGDAYVGATTVNGAVHLTTDIANVVDTSDIEGYTAATATGLATDAYVKDYVAYTLAWEDITE